MKKLIRILLICLIIAGIIVISTVGFNVGIRYAENTQININIGKEFEVADIKEITNEVFGKNKTVLIQQVEVYKEMVQITLKDATEEEISNLNNKINEKYELEHEISDVVVTNNPNFRLRDLVSPYILPVMIVSILTAIIAMVIYRELGMWKVLYKIAISIVAPQMILASIYAITRIPINKITPIVAILVYMLSITIPFINLNKIKNQNENKDKTKNK